MEKFFHFDRCKSLQELEDEYWDDPELNTHIVVTCHSLRKKPVGDLGIEDLRIMIGQNIGLDYLVPLALEVLEDDIFAAGAFYTGDLLDAVLKVDKEFWTENPQYKKELKNILEANIRDLESKLELFRQNSIWILLRSQKA